MSEFSMNESEKVIEKMDIPDENKQELYDTRKEFKKNYLETVGDLISKNVEGDFNPYVEHTNNGLNLRIVAHNQDNVPYIVAIGNFFELELISNNKTNSNSTMTWIRFRF